jgi:hypothetical protein
MSPELLMRAPSILIPLTLGILAGCKVDNRVLVMGSNGNAGSGGSTIVGIPITPSDDATFDGNNPAGVLGAWWSAGDYYDAKGTPGAGTCPRAGFPETKCSEITSPKPQTPIPLVLPGAVCTMGIVAIAPEGDGGQPDTSDVWGNTIGFDLNHPPGDGGLDGSYGANVYDSGAHHVYGFAFQISPLVNTPQDNVIPLPPIRVEFPTEGTEADPAYWVGPNIGLSPVSPGPLSGIYQIRWAEIGNPLDPSAPPFAPSKLKSIQFHVPSNAANATPYSYCILNTFMLTTP